MPSPARPALALPPRPTLRRGLWALPLVLSLAFVGGVLVWLHKNEVDEIDDQRQALITDALSLETQVSARIEREGRLLADLAARMPATPPGAQAFAALPDVQQGLHRFWVSITWLDAANRIVAHLPDQAPDPEATQAANRPGSGVSSHLSMPLESGGRLVARYSPSDMLRQTVPWWLARKYDVRLVDSFGDVMASTTETLPPPDRQAHSISMEPVLSDTYLELIARDRVTPWYRSFPMTMVAGFVILIGAITWMLRRQVLGVARAEEAWRTEAAWRSAMEDSLTVGLRARDLNGRILYVNRALADMVGHAPEDLVGLMPPMPYWPPDAIEEIMVRHLRNLAGHAPREGYESQWIHKDGRILDVLVFEAPLVDARGRRIGSMGSIVDISGAKRLEERERRQADAMAHHARLTMLGEVAATLAHELNQPLTAIASYNAGVLNSLQRPPAAPTDPIVLRALERVGQQAAHAGRIVQRIREFLTRHEPQFEACSINAVVEGGVALLKRELERQHVQLGLHLDPSLPPVLADAVLVEQVVINLVRNASDALGGQSGERRIDARTSLSADLRFVRVDVEDNGPGLQGRSAEALCAPFYSTKRDGMGMGLAICRSIVQAHHGAFDASEAPGGGACFSMTLPVAPLGDGDRSTVAEAESAA
jgi:two-component system sensor histidine kinase DctS